MRADFRTHGLAWRQKVRDAAVFVALVTPGWHGDGFVQRQYAYARALGKPIVLLVQAGTPLPPGADDYCWKVWSTLEECAALIQAIERGELP